MRGSPRQNSMIVGMPWTSKAWATCGFLSTFTFTVRMRPRFSRASRSIVGETILHGPHHSAQKSTSTGISEIRTSSKKDPGSPFARPALISAKILTAGTPVQFNRGMGTLPPMSTQPHVPTRAEALQLFLAHNSTESLKAHALSVEAVMRHYARKYGEDEEKLGIIGLVHDI